VWRLVANERIPMTRSRLVALALAADCLLIGCKVQCETEFEKLVGKVPANAKLHTCVYRRSDDDVRQFTLEATISSSADFEFISRALGTHSKGLSGPECIRLSEYGQYGSMPVNCEFIPRGAVRAEGSRTVVVKDSGNGTYVVYVHGSPNIP